MTESTIVRRAIPMISAASERLIGLFQATEIGESVTYDQMSAAAGFDVRERRGVIDTARKRAQQDDAIHFGVIRGEGFRRLTHAEAAETLSADITKSRNAARKGSRKAMRISVLDVPADRRPAFVARATLCELITESTKTRQQLRLAEAASDKPENTAILAQREALEALKGG